MGGRNPEFYLGHVNVGMTKYQTSTLEKEMQLFKTLLSKSKSLRFEWKQNTNICCFFKTQRKPNDTKKLKLKGYSGCQQMKITQRQAF